MIGTHVESSGSPRRPSHRGTGLNVVRPRIPGSTCRGGCGREANHQLGGYCFGCRTRKTQGRPTPAEGGPPIRTYTSQPVECRTCDDPKVVALGLCRACYKRARRAVSRRSP